MKQKYYELTTAQALQSLETSVDGLPFNEAAKRLKYYGLNELPQPQPDHLLVIFLRQFTSPLVYILLLVAGIVLFFREYTDAIVIASVLVFNAIVGTVQEGRAQNTLAALRKFVVTKALVRRNGEEERIPDAQLVPGDIVVLREGDKIPADGRILVASGMTVDESSLTGESEPVAKIIELLKPELPAKILYPHEQKNMAFKGTHVVGGDGEMVVVSTGQETEIGKISRTIEEHDTEIPLQANIRHMSRLIMLAVALISTFLLAAGTLMGRPFLELVKTVVSLAVSLIPEGLPVVMTLVLANGVWRMSQRRALVKKLAAVEALGQANVVAVDKTGTITKNEMVIQKVVIGGKTYLIGGSGYDPHGQIVVDGQPVQPEHVSGLRLAGRIAAFADADLIFVPNDKSWTVAGDPTEGALLVLARKVGINLEQIKVDHKPIQEIPFTYQTKFRAMVTKEGGGHLLTVTGAPEAVGELCGMSEEAVHRLVEPLSRDGLRVLAFAFANVAGTVNPGQLPKLTFGGLYAMRDTLHPEVPSAVKTVQSSGVKVVMITGDHKLTAEAIARSAGIYRNGDLVLTGRELDEMSNDKLDSILPRVSVFARVTPEHKFRIVNAFQSQGLIVAMTGDGVNDIPSLVTANLGIAMGVRGTEVTKEAADIILMDDNFTTIVAAIEEGRHIYRTIKRVLLYLFSTSIGELLTIAGGLLAGLPLPIVAVQILWCNFVTDGFLTITFAMEHKDRNGLNGEFPKPSKYLIDQSMVLRMLPMALIMMAGTLSLFAFYLDEGYLKATTMALTVLAVFQWFNAWNCRSEEGSIFRNLFTNPYLIGATVIVIILQIAAVHTAFLQKLLHTTSLTLQEWGIVLAVASTILIFEETRKLIFKGRNK